MMYSQRCRKIFKLFFYQPSEVLEVTTKFMNDPIKILVKKEELTLEGIRQFYVTVEREVNAVSSNVFELLFCS